MGGRPRRAGTPVWTAITPGFRLPARHVIHTVERLIGTLGRGDDVLGGA
jgi:O-acetyl-ADP-ribose deacetylase (regulator of RNase III)